MMVSTTIARCLEPLGQLGACTDTVKSHPVWGTRISSEQVLQQEGVAAGIAGVDLSNTMNFAPEDEYYIEFAPGLCCIVIEVKSL